ncbi:DNA polymerase III subunit gamma/tau [Candidatus Saccharibacteria bacterium]|nr:DNA polymerase III subunit gamma/tau [Candidatus Saccharibacteria bacterium]
MSQAFYRKYRSRSLDEVVGQEPVTATLAKALKTGRVRHAYLFSGPRGVGKTTVARILAHAVNQLPYKADDFHLDIIEIDAASNRRIDEIRELRDKVNVSPTSAEYKVYIIDEVHMLTREAFNALLKTLEEPPAHCIFILATTEPHKLPETIISRTQHFNFRPLPTGQVAAHLKTIAKREKLTVEDGALELLAQFGQGSFRDSISLLDQLSSHDQPITLESASQFIGLPPPELINSLVEALGSADSQSALAILDKLELAGASPAISASLLAANLRQRLTEGQVADWAIPVLRQLLEIPASSQPKQALELAVLETASRLQTVSPETKPGKIILKPPKAAATPTPAKQPPAADVVMNSGSSFNLADWPQVLAQIEQNSPSLYSALRLAVPSLENGSLNLNFGFELHRKKVNQVAQREQIAKVVEDLTGSKLKINCLVNKSLATEAPPAQPADDSSLEAISNIFGQAEMLES